MKKTISFILALVMTLSVLFGLNISAFAQDIHGKIGDNITFDYKEGTKTLTLSGTGAIIDCEESPFISLFENKFGNKIVISSGITYIGENLFSGTSAFTSVEIANTVKEIGENAFSSTRIAVFNIPSSVTTIGDYAFCPSSDSKSTKMFTTAINVDAANNFFTSRDGVLYNKDMTKLIQAPSAFSGNNGDFKVPDTVIQIGKSAFMKCLNLKSVLIPKSVELINESAFSLCKNLTDITIENDSTNLDIKQTAFRYSYYDSQTQKTISVLNNENMLFKVYQNSSALIYAKNNGIDYELIDPDVPAVTGWQNIGGKWYYFDDNGDMLKSRWLYDGGWFYLGDDGAMATGWVKVSNKWYYLNSHGVMLTGWVRISNVWYYLDRSGEMLTGWQQIGSYWYFFNASGSMRTGWLKSGNYWYFLNSSGSMRTGWLSLNGSWYYLDSPSGRMRTANLTYKGKVYRFYSSGVCINP